MYGSNLKPYRGNSPLGKSLLHAVFWDLENESWRGCWVFSTTVASDPGRALFEKNVMSSGSKVTKHPRKMKKNNYLRRPTYRKNKTKNAKRPFICFFSSCHEPMPYYNISFSQLSKTSAQKCEKARTIYIYFGCRWNHLVQININEVYSQQNNEPSAGILYV